MIDTCACSDFQDTLGRTAPKRRIPVDPEDGGYVYQIPAGSLTTTIRSSVEPDDAAPPAGTAIAGAIAKYSIERAPRRHTVSRPSWGGGRGGD